MTATAKKTRGPALVPSAPALSPLATLARDLGACFYERSEPIAALLGAVVAGQHACLLGPPGTAKSELARGLASGLGLSFWERLLTRFSTPEDVFGPVKLSALQRDSYERAIGGYLPTAELAFLDECFKANAAILNALLGVLNERQFSNGAGAPLACPLVSCIGASNELPEAGPELSALWDRFLVRLHVGYLSERASFDSLLFGARAPLPAACVDVAYEQAQARGVTFAAELPDAVWTVREACKRDGYAVSDRRWRQCLSLVRATAHLDGRTVATPDDLSCLEHVLWSEPDQRVAVSKLVQSTVNPNGARAVQYLDDAEQAFKAAPVEGSMGKRELAAACADAIDTLTGISDALALLGTGRKVNDAIVRVDRMTQDVRGRVSRAMGLSL